MIGHALQVKAQMCEVNFSRDFACFEPLLFPCEAMTDAIQLANLIYIFDQRLFSHTAIFSDQLKTTAVAITQIYISIQTKSLTHLYCCYSFITLVVQSRTTQSVFRFR